jgi:hypothetical protein
MFPGLKARTERRRGVREALEGEYARLSDAFLIADQRIAKAKALIEAKHEGATTELVPGMSVFPHQLLRDSETERRSALLSMGEVLSHLDKLDEQRHRWAMLFATAIGGGLVVFLLQRLLA